MYVGRLRDMWGGGFTEAVRFLWERHRFPFAWQVLIMLHPSNLQGLVVTGRPGLAQHPGLPVTLADPSPPLRVALPHVELQHRDLREPVHLEDEGRDEPVPERGQIRGLSAARQLPGFHDDPKQGGEEAFQPKTALPGGRCASSCLHLLGRAGGSFVLFQSDQSFIHG